MKISICVILAAFICSPLFAATSCEDLLGAKLPHATITMARIVKAGKFKAPAVNTAARRLSAKTPAINPFEKVPAFCRVAATLEPSLDSQVRVEIWLPLMGWNNKLLSVGNGGWAGTISYNDMARPLTSGYAVASTDTGHKGSDGGFVTNHPEQVIDFSYRAVHEMTVAAKSIIASFYGRGPVLSYFSGCSTGGRQALTEAERFPLDYDGIVAGAAAVNSSRLHATQIWFAQQMHRDKASIIPDAKIKLLHEAVLYACDGLDNVSDRVLNDPRQCRFDPGVLRCDGKDTKTCLTAAQVETARRVYAGPGLFPGLEVGSEGSWGGANGVLTKPVGIAYDEYRYFALHDSKWDYKTLNLDSDIPAFDKAIGATMNSSDTNLDPFFDHGGKLLMYHGWADPGIPPGNSVQFYSDVVKHIGDTSKAANSISLFMLPGVGHCRGGDGPSSFDAVGTVDQWRVDNKPPASITASRMEMGKVESTRPLCPYPQVVQYKGSGNPKEAANFVCR
jgi:feruloyl esterase